MERVKYYEITNQELNFINDGDKFRILLLTDFKSKINLNFNELSLNQPSLIFLCPGEVLTSTLPIESCRVIEFIKGSLAYSERFILLLYCSSLRDESSSTAVKKLIVSNANRIKLHFDDIKRRFLYEESNEESVLLAINDLIQDCLFFKIYGQSFDVIKFHELLNENYKTKHLVSDYAEILKTHPKVLLREFKKRAFRIPSLIIKLKIILESKKLLLLTDLNAKQIGLTMGFEDPAYFARFFRKNTGITVLNFREQYRKH